MVLELTVLAPARMVLVLVPTPPNLGPIAPTLALPRLNPLNPLANALAPTVAPGATAPGPNTLAPALAPALAALAPAVTLLTNISRLFSRSIYRVGLRLNDDVALKSGDSCVQVWGEIGRAGLFLGPVALFRHAVLSLILFIRI